jgi:hypothetical protein
MSDSNIKDIITNIMAILLVIGGSLQAYMQSLPSADGNINFVQLGLTVCMAVVAWFTGKAPNGTKLS